MNDIFGRKKVLRIALGIRAAVGEEVLSCARLAPSSRVRRCQNVDKVEELLASTQRKSGNPSRAPSAVASRGEPALRTRCATEYAAVCIADRRAGCAPAQAELTYGGTSLRTCATCGGGGANAGGALSSGDGTHAGRIPQLPPAPRLF